MSNAIVSPPVMTKPPSPAPLPLGIAPKFSDQPAPGTEPAEALFIFTLKVASNDWIGFVGSRSASL